MKIASRAWIVMILAIVISASTGNHQEIQLDQKKIDAAIDNGCKWLLANISQAYGKVLTPDQENLIKWWGMDTEIYVRKELVLLTLIYGGYFKETDDNCKKLLQSVLDDQPKFTYRAALKAMALNLLDGNKYIEFIAECGQALIDNQAKEGRWSYQLQFTRTKTPEVNMSEGAPETKLIGNVLTRTGGDNSNTAYAALGLRACFDAGVIIPKETVELALKWWEVSQFSTGNWRYGTIGKGLAANVDPSTIPLVVGDIDMFTGLEIDKRLVMTTGGIAASAIYKYMLGQCKKVEDFAKDLSIAAGLKWLGDNYKFEGGAPHKGTDGFGDYYYYYGIERSGMLTGIVKMGTHDWYKEGATWLLANQRPNGDWGLGAADTCFAILFLKRATEPVDDN